MQPRSVLLAILTFSTFTVMGALSSTARAKPAFLCDPVPVGIEEGGDVCECKFFNYGRVPRTVSIKIFSGLEGQVAACSNVAVAPERGTKCTYKFDQEDDCACKVEIRRLFVKLRSRASINILNPFGGPRPWDGRACR